MEECTPHECPEVKLLTPMRNEALSRAALPTRMHSGGPQLSAGRRKEQELVYFILARSTNYYSSAAVNSCQRVEVVLVFSNERMTVVGYGHAALVGDSGDEWAAASVLLVGNGTCIGS